MQENESKKKHKAGLHKEISSIFEGVPIPGRDNAKQPSDSAPAGPAEQRPTPKPIPPMSKPKAAGIPKSPAGKSRIGEMWQKIKKRILTPEEGVSPTKHKIMLVIVPSLIIVLIFVLMPFFKSPSGAISTAQKSKSKDVAAVSKREIDWEIPEPYPAGLRDPMQPSSSAKAGTEGAKAEAKGIRMSRLPVRGIVYSKDNPAAVVGTQLVHEGDTISDVTIVKINEDSIEFRMNNQRWTQKVE